MAVQSSARALIWFGVLGVHQSARAWYASNVHLLVAQDVKRNQLDLDDTPNLGRIDLEVPSAGCEDSGLVF
ncbi:hypothetical protein F4780DRAFT_757663 [Xylariomycetidae sp. FL0641]|nr:hypothetical protein F4780DRAFT_757663 [Xylariomycetidae sp. FL0641]